MKRILVGFDGSPRAGDVLAAALGLAKQTGARLDLVRAVTVPPHLPAAALSVSPDALPGMLVAHEEQELRAGAATLPADQVHACHARLGTPWQVICELAKELDVDLIVVGSHGHSVLDRVLGTTAAKVVNHADRSVLVVRNSARLG